MKITALTENTSRLGLPSEHGLSLYIETESHRLLFDAGQSDLFARNAARSRFAFEPHLRSDGTFIGLDKTLKESERLIFCGEETKIADGLTLYAKNDAKKVADLGSFGLNMEQDGKVLPDDFRHEHYLLIEENGKRVLISGCSHKGILNIAEWFRPDVLVGGFHFSKLPLDETLAGYAKQLDGCPTTYYTCHCTGTAQFEFMSKYMKRLRYISAGDVIEI